MSNYSLMTVLASGKEKRVESNTLTMDFSAIRIGADTLSIVQGGTGGTAYLDLGARSLRTTFVPSNAADLVNLLALNNAIATLQAGVSWQDAVATRASAPVGGETTGKRVLITELGNVAITAVVTGLAGTITVAGDVTTFITAGDVIKVKGSTNNNSYFTVTSATFNTPDTDIVVVETVGAVADGTVHYAGATFKTFGVDKIATKTVSAWSVGAVPATGWATLVNDDTGKMWIYGITSWSASYFEATTASLGVKKVGFDIRRDDASTFTNDNGSTINIRQVVYEKSNGNVDLALATNAALYSATNGAVLIGLVEDATIATATPGKITTRQGALVSGFTGLTPGASYYLSRTVAGAIDLFSNIVWAANDQVIFIGKAQSATELLFAPEYKYEY